MSKDEVINLFELIVEVYPRFTISASRVEAWHELLLDMPYKSARKNVVEHCKNSKFEPTVADVRAGKVTREYKSDSVDLSEFLKGVDW